MTTNATTTELRRCIGSAKFGIEAHEAPPDEFPAQPSQKDGLGRMCKPHWNQYTNALRKAALVNMEGPALAHHRGLRGPFERFRTEPHTGGRSMDERTRFVGLDVHKASIAVAVAEAFGDPEDHGQIANDPSAVRKLMQRLGGADVHLEVAYEAGPTGYALHRQLTAMGIACVVVAPSLIPVKPGDRIKTDQRDAAKLARLLRSGDLTPVWVPDEAHEALRDLVRARDDAKADLLRAKHRLSKFLLRRAIHPPVGVRAWSRAHDAWLAGLTLEHAADGVVLDALLAVVREAGERVRRLEAALAQCAAASPHAELLAALQAIRGIGFLTAVTIVAEAGDLRRFPTARPVHGLRRPGPLRAFEWRLAAPWPHHQDGQSPHPPRAGPGRPQRALSAQREHRPCAHANAGSRRRSSSSTGGPRPGSMRATAIWRGGSAPTRPSSRSPASSPASSGRPASCPDGPTAA